MPELDRYKEWEGSAEDLAKTAGEILAERNLAEYRGSPNARLIRDYAQRGIVSRPERRGKEVVYGFRHLLELVAARFLVRDGWPLARISDHIGRMSDSEIIALMPGREKLNPALTVVQRLRRESGSSATGDSVLSSSQRPPARAGLSQHGTTSALVPTFHARVARASKLQAELRDSMQRLGLPAESPPVEQVTVIAVAPWCQILIQSSRLSQVTDDEADEIGRAITASLLDPAIRKGVK